MQREWFDRGLDVNVRIRIAGLGLIIAYALAYLAARQISFDQFHLPAGIRVSFLLLCPPRLWPYLLAGEYAAIAWLRVPLLEKYGLTWVLLGSAFVMPSVMLILRAHRRVMEEKTGVWIISTAISSALAATLLNLGMSHLLLPAPPGDDILTKATRYVVGDFIGILTLVPLAMLWINRGTNRWPARNLLLPTVACLLLMVTLGFLAQWTPGDAGTARTNLLLLMVLPAVALTCLHGWRGAAISIPLWSLMTRLTMPLGGQAESFDPAAFSAQQNVAVVGIALLVVGSFLSHYYQQHLHRDLERSSALAHTKAAQIAGEMDLRRRALDIRNLGDRLDGSLSELADWLKQKGHHDLADSLVNLAVVHSQKFREQITMVYPTSIEHVGLYLALQIGGINEAWKLTNRLALHQLNGDPCKLSIGLQLAAYRALTDAVSLLLQNETGQIQIRARSWGIASQQGILMSVALLDPARHLSPDTMAMAIEHLTGRTLAYSGTVQCRRNRIRMMLVESVVDGQPVPRLRALE